MAELVSELDTDIITFRRFLLENPKIELGEENWLSQHHDWPGLGRQFHILIYIGARNRKKTI